MEASEAPVVDRKGEIISDVREPSLEIRHGSTSVIGSVIGLASVGVGSNTMVHPSSMPTKSTAAASHRTAKSSIKAVSNFMSRPFQIETLHVALQQ